MCGVDFCLCCFFLSPHRAKVHFCMRKWYLSLANTFSHPPYRDRFVSPRSFCWSLRVCVFVCMCGHFGSENKQPRFEDASCIKSRVSRGMHAAVFRAYLLIPSGTSTLSHDVRSRWSVWAFFFASEGLLFFAVSFPRRCSEFTPKHPFTFALATNSKEFK